jgi:hypothetical protein
LAEYEFKLQQSRRQRFDDRMSEVRKVLEQATTEQAAGAKLDTTYPPLIRALNSLDLLLDEESGNSDALVLKAELAIHFIYRALEADEIAFAELLFNVGRSTGKHKDEFDKLDALIKSAKARK